MDCNRPPGFDKLTTLGGDSDANGTPSDLRLHHQMPTYMPSRNILGARILVSGDNEQCATAGGVVRWRGKYFVITVAHIFSSPNTQLFPDAETSSEFEYNIDAFSDTEDIDDATIEQMSKASMTTDNSDSDDSNISGGLGSQSSLQEVKGAAESNRTLPSRRDVCQQPKMSMNIEDSLPLDPAKVRSNASLFNLPEEANATDSSPFAFRLPKPATRISVILQSNNGISEQLCIGDTLILSTNGPCPVLDYALLEISRSQLDKFSEDTLIKLSAQVKKVPRASKVVAVTASGGIMPGQLLATPSFMRPPHSQSCQKLWTVKLQGALAKGDCGSWILDAVTGDIYGHIIAGSPGAGFAYIIPMLRSSTICNIVLGANGN
jgi:hypothetical protein